MSEKKAFVTYEKFLEAVEEMRSEGGVPTLRKIQARIGGSNTTIQGCWNQWLQSLLAANRIGHENLSRGLLDKIVTEMDRHGEKVVETIKGRLEVVLQQLSECETEKNRAEASVEELHRELDALRQSTSDQIKSLEARLEQGAGRAAAMKESVTGLQEERDRALNQERESREAAARSSQEAERASAEAQRLETSSAELSREIESLRERLSQAEKQTAVSEERARQLETTVSEQRTRIDALADAERSAIEAEARLQTHSSPKKRKNGNGTARSSSKEAQPGSDL